MTFEPKTWACGDTITAQELNRMEQGIDEASQCGGLKYVKDDSSDNGGVVENMVSGATIIAEGSEYIVEEENANKATGNFAHAEGGTLQITPEYDPPEVWVYNTASGIASHAEGGGTTASGDYSHVEGYTSTASGFASHAEGYSSTASGNSSHAEGSNTTAGGNYSHAEGYYTNANGPYSHAEGNSSKANGDNSHAEGGFSYANGETSHVEGHGTLTSGSCSHAEGYYTSASHRSQHVFGECNALDPSSAQATERGTYVEIVGNGASRGNRSNARTLDWSGNEVLQGSLTLGKGTADETTITATQLKALLALLNS